MTPSHVWVVSLGDSYTAGNAAGNYYDTPADCYRSYNSYSWRYIAALRAAGHSADNWLAACSGKWTYDVDGQIASVPANVRSAANVVLITIGGNDFGFGNIVKYCLAAPGTFLFFGCPGSINSALNNFNDIVYKRTKNVLTDIGLKMPNAQVVLVGYPHLTRPGCGSIYDGTLESMQSTYDEAQATVVAQMNQTTHGSRFHWLSTASAFTGHGPCSATANQYITNYVVNPNIWSFHPNATGHQIIANLISAQHYEQSEAPTTPPPPPPPPPGVPAGTYVSTCNLSGLNHCSGVNLRAGPVYPGTVVGTLPEGTTVTVDCWMPGTTITDSNGLSDNRWGWVEAAGRTGYVSFLYLWGQGVTVPWCDPSPAGAGPARLDGDFVQDGTVTFRYPLTNTGFHTFTATNVTVAVRGPGGAVLDVPCQNSGTVSIPTGATWECDAQLTLPDIGDYRAWLQWQGPSGQWTDGTPQWSGRWAWTWRVTSGPLDAYSNSAPTGDPVQGRTLNLTYLVHNAVASRSVTFPFIGVQITAPDGQVTDQPCDNPSGTNSAVDGGQVFVCSKDVALPQVGTYNIHFAYQRPNGQWGGNLFTDWQESVGPRPVVSYSYTPGAVSIDPHVGGAVHAEYTVTNTGNSGGRILPAFVSTYGVTSNYCNGIDDASTDMAHVGVYVPAGDSYTCVLDTVISRTGDLDLTPQVWSYGAGDTADWSQIQELFDTGPPMAHATITAGLTATATAIGQPVTGGSVQYNLTITNNTTASVDVNVQAVANRPIDSMYPSGIDVSACQNEIFTIAPGQSESCLTYPIDLTSAGTYTAFAQIGNRPTGGDPCWCATADIDLPEVTLQVADQAPLPTSTLSSINSQAAPPTADITAQPTQYLRSSTASFAFVGQPSVSDAALTYTCSLDGAAASACTSPTAYTDLKDGPHIFALTAHQDGASAASDPVSINWVVDTHPPTVALTAPTATATLSSATKVSWSGADTGGSGIATYQVRYTRAPYSAGFAAWSYPRTWQALTATSLTHTGMAQGYDYCYSVRTIDRAGNTSAWSAKRCSAVAFDDRELTVTTKGWTRATNSAWWNGTATTTATLNATLTRTNVQLDRVGIVATTCAKCGIAGIYVGGGLIGKINLYAAATHYRQVILLPAFRYLTGTIMIKTLSSGKYVHVDGMVSSRT